MPRMGGHFYTHFIAKRFEQDAQALAAQDRRVREALDEARARRDLGLERLGHPLKTKRSE